jgi:hypothetical protein
MADFDAQLPVRTIASEFTTEVANAAGTTINPAEDYAQGSTTSGENGVLAQGATTTSAPTYSTSTTNPLSLDVSGNLRVLTTPAAAGLQNVNLTQVGGSAISEGQKTMAASLPVVIASDQSAINVQFGGVTPLLTFFTDAAVASGATVTHSLAGPVILDKIDCSGSGELKMTVAIGVTASEVTYWDGFTSASNQNMEFNLPHPFTIAAGSSAKVTIKNRDTAAQDTYLTFFSH